jgi:2-desacetyl-2-hydroxyethyl bacteriochlorophyllide A dehydrogenase
MTVPAVLFDGPDRPLILGETPIANLAPDDVRLDIAACGICGSDLHMAHAPHSFGLSAGAVLGHEFAGQITEVGEDVTDLAIGDRVAVAPIKGCGHCRHCDAGEPAWCADMQLIGGGYAQSATVAARQCRIVPDGVSLADAAMAEPTAVALHAVKRAPLPTGAQVLVLGAGPIGLLVAFWARRLGAKDVVVADIAPYQKERALSVGATRFEMSDDGLPERLADAGIHPEVVYECVGREGLIDRAVALVRPRGAVVGIGLCVNTDRFDSFAALHKEVTIYMSAFFHMPEFEIALDALTEAQGAHPLKLVTDRVALESVPETFTSLNQKSLACKTLICPVHS